METTIPQGVSIKFEEKTLILAEFMVGNNNSARCRHIFVKKQQICTVSPSLLYGWETLFISEKFKKILFRSYEQTRCNFEELYREYIVTASQQELDELSFE